MDFDINTMRGLATVFAMIAFLSVVWWAYSGRQKERFDEAANIPFQDDPSKLSEKTSADEETLNRGKNND